MGIKRIFDAVNVLLPGFINGIPVCLVYLLNDIGLQHFGAVQAETAVIHGQEDGVRFVLRGGIDLQQKDFPLQPVDEIRQGFPFQIIGEKLFNVTIPRKQIPVALIFGSKSPVLVPQSLHTVVPLRHVQIERHGPKIIFVNQVVHLFNWKIWDAGELILQISQIN